MDYIGNQCPVCQKNFHADDDIVVCPDCGTPHHRACYEQLGHCSNEHRHAEGYDYQAEHQATKAEVKQCLSCGKENDKDAFFCKYCGAPLNKNDAENRQAQQNPAAGPFAGGQAGNPIFATMMDPLGGVKSDADFGDGVTAGEAAKYVKQNTPYFIRVFSNICNLNKSKFNFAAALFTGGYMLYRKMYKLGALFTALQIAMIAVETYLTYAYSSLYNEFISIYYNSFGAGDMVSSLMTFMRDRSVTDILVLYLPTLISIIRIVMMVVIGLCFNRMYFKHCKKQIIKIKETAGEENPETILQTKGGVNLALAVSLLVAYLIATYLPTIITNFM
ncbi:RING finger protein [Ruminococcus sp.]|uniref:RING finger protein n=1 Tax=Ruminococcus sp. TaxID=41978 RepID=UPI00388F2955